jgi:hypothetical protein
MLLPHGEGGRAVRGQAFHGELARHADPLLALVGPVVDQLGVGVPGNGSLDFLAAHALLNVGIVRDGL